MKLSMDYIIKDNLNIIQEILLTCFLILLIITLFMIMLFIIEELN